MPKWWLVLFPQPHKTTHGDVWATVNTFSNPTPVFDVNSLFDVNYGQIININKLAVIAASLSCDAMREAMRTWKTVSQHETVPDSCHKPVLNQADRKRQSILNCYEHKRDTVTPTPPRWKTIGRYL